MFPPCYLHLFTKYKKLLDWTKSKVEPTIEGKDICRINEYIAMKGVLNTKRIAVGIPNGS